MSKHQLQGPMSGGGSMVSKPLKAPPVGTGGKPRPACGGCGKEMLLDYRPGQGTIHRCEDCPSPDERAVKVRAPSGAAYPNGGGFYIGAFVPGQPRSGAATWALTDIDIRNPAFASLLPDRYAAIAGLQGNAPRAVYDDLQSAQMAVRIADRIYQSHAPWLVVPLNIPPVAVAPAPQQAQPGTPTPLGVHGYCIQTGHGSFATPDGIAALGMTRPKGKPAPQNAVINQVEVAVYRKLANAVAAASKAHSRFPSDRPFTVVPYLP